jgi:hypothetical protein
MMTLVLVFEVLPYLEELVRGLKANNGALVAFQAKMKSSGVTSRHPRTASVVGVR